MKDSCYKTYKATVVLLHDIGSYMCKPLLSHQYFMKIVCGELKNCVGWASDQLGCQFHSKTWVRLVSPGIEPGHIVFPSHKNNVHIQ
jgi:hypothetical protein